MKIDKEKFLRSLILSEQSDSVESILASGLKHHLLQENIEKSIYSLIMIIESKLCTDKNVTEYVSDNMKKVLSIFEEFDLKVPEIETMLEKIVSEDDGVAPTNQTSGIDATTPVIKPKKKTSDEEQEFISKQ